MSEKRFETIAAVAFLVIAVAHLVRVLMGTSILVEGISIPLWASGAAALLFGYLGWQALRLRRSR